MYLNFIVYILATSLICVHTKTHRLVNSIFNALSWMFMALNINIIETRKFVLLLVIYGVYLLSGAAIFKALETVNDVEQSTDIGKVRDLFILSHNLTEEEFDFMVRKVLEVVKRRCQRMDECGARWDYYSSVYFAVSVVTTIGYGHLSPETTGGKIFCMMFALFGIPLNIMILKLVGDRIVSLIQLTLRCIEQRYFEKEVTKLRSKTVTIILCLMVLMLVLGGILYNLTEPWTFLDGLYFCFVTFTTIGFGDLVPNEGRAPKGHYQVIIEVARAIVLVLGLSVIFAFVHLILAFAEDSENITEPAVIPHEEINIEKNSDEMSQLPDKTHKLCDE